MKKANCLLVAGLLAASGTVQAQSVFEGLSGNVGVAYQSYESKFSNFVSAATGNGLNVSHGNSTGAVGKLGVDYTWILSSKKTVSVGATYSLNSGSTVPVTITTLAGAAVNAGGSTIKTKQNVGIYVAPGLMLSESTLAYVKLGYVDIKSTDESVKSYSQSSFSYGIGGKFAYDEKSFVYAEANYLAGKKSNHVGGSGSTFTLKPSGYELVVGYGFKF